MYLLVDFEGFTDKKIIKKKYGLDQQTIPCLVAYRVVKSINELGNPCANIKSKWFQCDEKNLMRVKDWLISTFNKFKIDTVIYHGSYETTLFKDIRFKYRHVDLQNIYGPSLDKEEIDCPFPHTIESGRKAHFLLADYVDNGKLSKSQKANIENYNKLDVAKLSARFEKLLKKKLNDKSIEDQNRFLKINRKHNKE